MVAAEKRIDKEYLFELYQKTPFPKSGVVKFNPPRMGYPVDKHKLAQNTQHHFRLGQNPDFSRGTVINSGGLKWAFYNAHRLLDTGTWYWQYGVSIDGGQTIAWKDVYRFEITGQEIPIVTPAFGEWEHNIPTDRPRYLALKKDLGRYVPDDYDPEPFLQACAAFSKAQLPETLIFDDQGVLQEKSKTLNAVDFSRFIDKRTKEKFIKAQEEAVALLKAYLLTGEERHAHNALTYYYYIKEQYDLIERRGFLNDFTTGSYYIYLAHVLDTLYTVLDEQEKNLIIAKLIVFQKEDFAHFLYDMEHRINESHIWQHHLRNFFVTSLVLYGETEKAREWLEYVYELWLLRAPGGAGNTDGGWVPGNGYFEVSNDTLFLMPLWFTLFTGVNFFDTPWYQNVGKYLAYTSPPGHPAGAYGDNADRKHAPMLPLVQGLHLLMDTPWLHRYYAKLAAIKYGKSAESWQVYPLQKRLEWFFLPWLREYVEKEIPAPPLVLAESFKDVGLAAMHTDMENVENNVMVSMRSCPYGLVGHAHASQNAFNITYGGKPLFYRTGYYSCWADHHTLQCYRHSRAFNTVLADGMGQCLSPSGYGWLARFLHGQTISYALGDASNAYEGEILRDEFPAQAEKWNVDITPENGFGNPGVTKFRRHLIFLRPSLIIVYDELEAKQPVQWSLLLHSWNEITPGSNPNAIRTETETAVGLAEVYSSDTFQIHITDKFHAPAVDWLGNGKRKGIEYVNQWHTSAETEEKIDRCRFLTLIKVWPLRERDRAETITAKAVRETENGMLRITVDDWTIEAALDPTGPAFVKAADADEERGIITGTQVNELVLGNKVYPAESPGSTILVEQASQDQKGEIVKQCIDTLPDGAIHY